MQRKFSLEKNKSIGYGLLFFFSLVTQPAHAETSPEGRWRYLNCAEGNRVTIEFTQSTWTTTTEWFQDSNCLQPTASEISRGTYQVNGAFNGLENALSVPLTLSSVSLIPRSLAQTNYMNQTKVCDINTWKNGEEKSITGTTCAKDTAFGSINGGAVIQFSGSAGLRSISIGLPSMVQVNGALNGPNFQSF